MQQYMLCWSGNPAAEEERQTKIDLDEKGGGRLEYSVNLTGMFNEGSEIIFVTC